MSIAKLFVKIFGEDIFEKHTEQQKSISQQDGDAKDTKEEAGAADEAAISSMASQKPLPVTRTEDMCLPE